jgi:hypothetical protein
MIKEQGIISYPDSSAQNVALSLPSDTRRGLRTAGTGRGLCSLGKLPVVEDPASDTSETWDVGRGGGAGRRRARTSGAGRASLLCPVSSSSAKESMMDSDVVEVGP